MLDHIFMLVEADGPEIGYVASLGFVETYRRMHPGQGTQNVCYCFDNLFLELMWVNDSNAVRSDAIQRSRFYERSLWRTNGTCPFGIAWRRFTAGLVSAIPTWDFTPPYLPVGMSIPVAIDSDDPRQPMMFESPGSTPPLEWPMEKRESLQHSVGLGAVTEIRLTMPASVPQGNALKMIAQSDAPPVRIDQPGAYRLQLRIASLADNPNLHISLPVLS
jgi:hypothetical protein